MLEVLIIVCLIGLNGLFALSELAVISASRARLKAMAEAGQRGASQAMALARNPGRFLSAVQIGITLIGIANGAYSGEVFGQRAAAGLGGLGMPAGLTGTLGYGAVVVVITYLSVIIGELVPKNLALRDAEGIACLVAPSMTAFSFLAAPAVSLFDVSTRLIFRLLGLTTERRDRVTDEEIRALIAEAERVGTLEPGERSLISGVMRLADRSVVEVMTPRLEVDWVDIDADHSQITQRLVAARHSLLPAGEGSADALVGVVNTREVLAAMLSGDKHDINAHVRPAPVLPETAGALEALTRLRGAEVPMALIHDEYGHFEGILTPADILEAIAGVFRSDVDDENAPAVEREDGSWLLSASMPVDAMSEVLSLRLPEHRDYATMAGFLLSHFQHIPQAGETVDIDGWRFEVMDMDGRRIDKVLATRRNALRRQTGA